jgi:hypothetical protein
MKKFTVIFVLAISVHAQSQSVSIDSVIFDYSGMRKPCPYKNCYADTAHLDEVWARSQPKVWLVNDKGDSISVHDMCNSLPDLAEYGFIKLSIDWDGFIWKATLLSRDTTDYHLIDIFNLAKQARACPAILAGGTPRAVDVMLPLWRKAN